jgi:hypothetical protein
MEQHCKVDKTYRYSNGAKIHKMNDSCILESPDGKLTLYIGMCQKVFDEQRALNTKKPEIVGGVKVGTDFVKASKMKVGVAQ